MPSACTPLRCPTRCFCAGPPPPQDRPDQDPSNKAPPPKQNPIRAHYINMTKQDIIDYSKRLGRPPPDLGPDPTVEVLKSTVNKLIDDLDQYEAKIKEAEKERKARIQREVKLQINNGILPSEQGPRPDRPPAQTEPLAPTRPGPAGTGPPTEGPPEPEQDRPPDPEQEQDTEEGPDTEKILRDALEKANEKEQMKKWEAEWSKGRKPEDKPIPKIQFDQHDNMAMHGKGILNELYYQINAPDPDKEHDKEPEKPVYAVDVEKSVLVLIDYCGLFNAKSMHGPDPWFYDKDLHTYARLGTDKDSAIRLIERCITPKELIKFNYPPPTEADLHVIARKLVSYSSTRTKDIMAPVGYLSCKSGLLSLKTGHILPHNMNVLTTYSLNVDLVDNPQCPTFESMFIDEYGNINMGLLNQVVHAMAIALLSKERPTGHDNRNFVVFLGPPGSGKSSLMNLVAYMRNYVFANLSLSESTAREASTKHSLEALIGQDLAMDFNAVLGPYTESLEGLLTNDPTSVNPKNKGHDSLRNNKLCCMVAMNKFPMIDLKSPMWRRTIIVPFTRSFVDSKSSINNLPEKLEAETPAIFTKYVRHMIQKIKREGRQAIRQPEARTKQLAYAIGHDEGEFVREFTIKDPAHLTARPILNLAYTWYCNSHGIEPRPNKMAFAFKAAHGISQAQRARFEKDHSYYFFAGVRVDYNKDPAMLNFIKAQLDNTDDYWMVRAFLDPASKQATF